MSKKKKKKCLKCGRVLRFGRVYCRSCWRIVKGRINELRGMIDGRI